MRQDGSQALVGILRRAESARRGGRRDGDEVVPLGPKGAKTRQSLLVAGYQQLIQRGYMATSVEHIHEAAGVSLGTYYQYFRDKADLMATLVGEAILDTAEAMFRPVDLLHGPAGLRDLLEGFVSGYASTAAFQRVWEEATHVDEELAAFRREVSLLLEGRLSDAIVAGQRSGTVDGELDPKASARALAAMVDRYCYLTFVVDSRAATSTDEVVDSLSRLWVGALGLR